MQQQPTPDFRLGYALGARAARRSPGLSDSMLAAKALLAYGRASRERTVDKEQFVRGYVAAYVQRREQPQ